MIVRKPWVWNDVEHWTGADLMDTLRLLEDEDEAEDFLEHYAEVCHDEAHALRNLRYMTHLISANDPEEGEEDAQRICEIFMLDPWQDSDWNTWTAENWYANSSLGIKVETQLEAS